MSHTNLHEVILQRRPTSEAAEGGPSRCAEEEEGGRDRSGTDRKRRGLKTKRGPDRKKKWSEREKKRGERRENRGERGCSPAAETALLLISRSRRRQAHAPSLRRYCWEGQRRREGWSGGVHFCG
jgi:hypothetical protein